MMQSDVKFIKAGIKHEVTSNRQQQIFSQKHDFIPVTRIITGLYFNLLTTEKLKANYENKMK